MEAKKSVALTLGGLEQLGRYKARDQRSQSIDTGSLRHDLCGLCLGPANTAQVCALD
jgi:hypothetical protein